MSQELDQYQLALEQKIHQLQDCQNNKGYKSCLPCPKLNDCPLRDDYVNAVYESMNKGKGGGFEF